MLLTITPGIQRAISRAEEADRDAFAKLTLPSDPSLEGPKPGNPISHGQLINLSKLLKEHSSNITENDEEISFLYTLEYLLQGSTIYTPPPPPKKEPTPEFKALMARLRAEEEARAYERMINPAFQPETFSQRYPTTQFSVGAGTDFGEEDELNYAEVHRQIILIINVLVSIIACSIFIWVAARHWSVGLRLGLSMGGSGAVAIAEVVVYSGYVRKIQEAKKKEKKKPEIKKIIQSWVIDKDSKENEAGLSSGSKDKAEDSIRYRKGKHR